MPARMTPPFRADHVGSLLRPPELLRAPDDFAAGRISEVKLALRPNFPMAALTADDGRTLQEAFDWFMDQLMGLQEAYTVE
jgi:hypothetical protein